MSDTPPSLFPLYMDQPLPVGAGNLVDNIIVLVDDGPEIVLETED